MPEKRRADGTLEMGIDWEERWGVDLCESAKKGDVRARWPYMVFTVFTQPL